MEKQSNENNDGIAQNATKVFYGDYLVKHISFDPSNGSGCGCKKGIVCGSCLR